MRVRPHFLVREIAAQFSFPSSSLLLINIFCQRVRQHETNFSLNIPTGAMWWILLVFEFSLRCVQSINKKKSSMLSAFKELLFAKASMDEPISSLAVKSWVLRPRKLCSLIHSLHIRTVRFRCRTHEGICYYLLNVHTYMCTFSSVNYAT